MKGLVTCTLLCFCIQHFCYHLLLWILTIEYIMKSSMQKFYKILTMHSFWSHKTSKFKQWLCQQWLLKVKMHPFCTYCEVIYTSEWYTKMWINSINIWGWKNIHLTLVTTLEFLNLSNNPKKFGNFHIFKIE